ncbi:MAG: alkaline phosphatase family protein [Longimicrobiales bacterium]
MHLLRFKFHLFPLRFLAFLSLWLGLWVPSLSFAQQQASGTENTGPPEPRLVVFLVVDQLRGDLLDRYSSAFSGGLKRILEEGLSFTNALHNHAATETSPGHAALSTGVHPARAGIPSNAWRDGAGRGAPPVYNVTDPDHGLVGVSGLPGSSPAALQRTGLADWVLDADREAMVISISGKDRAAVLMAGKTRGNVYWFNSTVGRFVTSTFYRKRNPSWLVNFNEQVLESYRADSVWNSTVPPELSHLSAPDTADFEGDGVHTFFPHRFAEERIDPGMDDFFIWFEKTPMLDDATLALARIALKETGAGSREGRTDFLSVSLSQTDRVGHEFGPLSREQMDNLLRMDASLGRFLDFLDASVGPENYLLGLTADHGVMTVPERMNQPGVRLGTEDRSRLEGALGQGVRQAHRNGPGSMAPFVLEALEELDFVGPAFSHEELRAQEGNDSLSVLFRHSFVPDRPGGLLSPYGVEMWWAENTVAWNFPTGTTHGSPFHYDRWVPLVLMGPGIQAGREGRPVMPLSLAPTLAWLAGIPYPEDLDGEPLVREGGGI